MIRAPTSDSAPWTRSSPSRSFGQTAAWNDFRALPWIASSRWNVGKASPSPPNNPTGAASIPVSAAKAAPPFWRRPRAVLAVALLLGLAAGGFWAYQIWNPRNPAIPEINLVDVDPEIDFRNRRVAWIPDLVRP